MKRVLNYVGSKWNLARWIVNQMPEHEVYLEPFFGSGAVLFNKQPARIETINDLDGNIVNLFKVIRDQPGQLAQQIQLMPYSRQEYNESFTALKDELNALERARVFLVRCWMSRGGKTSALIGWRHNVDSKIFSALPDWRKLPAIVLEATERLKHVQIENLDATTLIRR
ncbi:DNA adenine methylase [Lysinibacillus sp. NPDC093197]|uniref:DNA adenine methylase n=1 Tax=Lysinibacillus sp. NPDC093197 TaxID=3364132 RepID=UPI00380F40C5